MIGSFTIEFPVHLAQEKKDYCRFMIREDGGTIIEIGPNTWRIDCDKPKILNHVGWMLFNSVVAKHCRITETAGAAENRAGAYVYPTEWGWKKKK